MSENNEPRLSYGKEQEPKLEEQENSRPISISLPLVECGIPKGESKCHLHFEMGSSTIAQGADRVPIGEISVDIGCTALVLRFGIGVDRKMFHIPLLEVWKEVHKALALPFYEQQLALPFYEQH